MKYNIMNYCLLRQAIYSAVPKYLDSDKLFLCWQHKKQALLDRGIMHVCVMALYIGNLM